MKAFERKVKDLSDQRRSHLAWRLDNKTACGYITAGHIARCTGDWGDKSLLEVFVWAGCSEQAAKIHAYKVATFVPKP